VVGLKRAKETAAFISDETIKRIVLVDELMEWGIPTGC